ncbi:Transcriptional regulator, GntR family [Parafrankia sp. Ea1.12]|uniref:GntR family transcriptional regulator n=1 Tax=Parafrankia sp. Ea1.12 TaxID=573499 RepID=UPI000DA5AC1D|nr:GntR family transcriptional regulator [Parafrankia sp. Ea1.12]SQD94356.1 Transcriptional regulator, GntR family [Parafrankia sp. Ea1.12]
MATPGYLGPRDGMPGSDEWAGAGAGPAAVADARQGRPRRLRLGATARDRVADVLRDEIMSGRLGPGARIDLDETAAWLGTSRTPVREACLALQFEGLVRVAPRSGVTVIGLRQRDVEDNFALIAMLSGAAAAWAAERISEAHLAELRRLAADVRSAVETGGDLRTANFLFHRAVNQASDSVRLIALIRQTGRIIPWSFFDLVPEQVGCALREHDDIVDAIAAHNGARARRVSEEHVVSAGRLLVARVFGPGPAGAGSTAAGPAAGAGAGG